MLPTDTHRCFVNRRSEEVHQEAAKETDAACATVEIVPAPIKGPRRLALEGVAMETIEAPARDKIECRFRANRHLLIVCEQVVRRAGDTFVEGAPRSSLRYLTKKLTFVPAGCEYHERSELQINSRMTYFYLDPGKMRAHFNGGDTELAPRLHFEHPVIWQTAEMMRTGGTDRGYLEALGVVLAYQLVRLNFITPSAERPIRGGLAAWQERRIAAHIEEHVAERISLTALAHLASLSPFHFCRVFKQSFGMSPHQYHLSRRIERAKILLCEPTASVTDVGLTVGYNETGSFCSSFKKVTGVAPLRYRRSLLATQMRSRT